MSPIPVVFCGKDYFAPLLEFYNNMLKENMIDKDDLSLFMMSDDVDEIVSYIEANSLFE
jgi:predicted Rossmann-fold nucleotide-binding protein